MKSFRKYIQSNERQKIRFCMLPSINKLTSRNRQTDRQTDDETKGNRMKDRKEGRHNLARDTRS